MGNRGIISYNEYLFLLCIITKPKQGFDVAFKMFDTDGNKLIDYDEFKMLESIFRQSAENNAEEQVRLHHLNMTRQSTFVIHTRDMISFVTYRSHIPSYCMIHTAL